MQNRILRFVAFFVALFPVSANGLTAQPSRFPVRAGVVVAKIEADKSVYHSGESIMLRLSLVNKSGRQLLFSPQVPYAMSTLYVFDASGRKVGLTGTPAFDPCAGRCGGNPYTVELDPGKPVIVEYNDPENHWLPSTWADIKRWGYDLSRPGAYSLVVSPEAGIWGAGVPEFETSPADNSIPAHIRVVN